MRVLAQLDALARNLWWSWDDEGARLWPDLDAATWRRVGHNPVALLAALTADQRAAIAADAELGARVAAIGQRLAGYLQGTGWAGDVSELRGRRIAYLSMEFGLHESLALYSGGLGVLAGDHLRSASDLGLPLVGLGLLWREGYFHQRIVEGRQEAWYVDQRPERLPLTRVSDDEGPVRVTVPIGDDPCQLAVWRLDVGRVPLYLLDADVPENPPELRALTSRLYAGGGTVRCRQEALLGLGGIRLLNRLGITPDVVHLNEGHCAFAALQLAVDALPATGNWRDACASARAKCVFTTHTPVPAGHDRFGWSDIDGVLGRWRDRIGLPQGAIMDLGREDPRDLAAPLTMTVLALRLSAAANGVSALHGRVSREMWASLWPGVPVGAVPIGHVTNGVHPTFWVSRHARALFDRHIDGWRERPWESAIWQSVDRIPDADIEAMRAACREDLVALVRERTGKALDPTRLTIGFARRFAPYKRGDLLFTDSARLARWLVQGAQLVYAGKAHPEDVPGQQILARVATFASDPRFADQVVLVPDYDIEAGRALTSGADVWLNTPRRPHEASGTSGQKVVYNGGLNLSILDGWWVEGFDGTNGWAIGDGAEHADVEAGDAADAADLYRILEDEVWPTWEDRAAWNARIRRSWQTCAPAFSSHRMVRDYANEWYIPRWATR